MDKRKAGQGFRQRHRPQGPVRRHHHRLHHAAEAGAAGGITGAAVAGAVPVATHYLGKEATTKLADEVIGGLPKTMVAGLGIGVMIGGLGAYLMHQHRDGADERERDGGGGSYGDGFADGFREGRRENHSARLDHERNREHHSAPQRG